ncbi:Ubiquinol-cytochrome C chaperone [Seminavis robusta]|uniref:Ubiquinol-cytochrome C chaperone n=1 Tax=Seminavis robusta TaxID=568900 RepID=A0A9N8HLC9_9STRA|nr:Ubiquinol-cytochrome C chaperone [Seminavis robusta]|eukprot:Sro812_g206030.1 Ubiquinol-cytochrome C chaperone (378) ;mRNA; r:9257-10490
MLGISSCASSWVARSCARRLPLRSIPRSRLVAASSTGTSSATGSSTFQHFSSSSSSLQDASDLAEAQPSPTSQERGFLDRLMDRWSIRRQQDRIRIGEELFQAATRQANDPRWYGPGCIPRDFRSRHAMVTMHIWFLHKRLVASTGGMDPDWAMLIQDELFRILWNDTLCRIRQQGVYEMSVEKNLQKVQKYTFLHLFHYDHIYQDLTKTMMPADDDDNDDDTSNLRNQSQPSLPEDREYQPWDPLSVIDQSADLTQVQNRIKELKKLVWMHLMVRDPDAKQCDDHLERIAWYIETQFQNILVDWPTEYATEARVAWVDLPDFSYLKRNDGKPMKQRRVNPDDVLPAPWLTNITQRGEAYYWNPKTKKSQWKRPMEG